MWQKEAATFIRPSGAPRHRGRPFSCDERRSAHTRLRPLRIEAGKKTTVRALLWRAGMLYVFTVGLGLGRPRI